MPWNDYFELKWTSSLAANLVEGQPASITRRYHMTLLDAAHTTRKKLDGISFNLAGQIMRVRVPFRPRHVLGLVRVDEDVTIVAPNGSLAELEEAATATDLEAKLWTDDAYWAAEWLQDWTPQHYDPGGEYWAVPMELRQRQ